MSRLPLTNYGIREDTPKLSNHINYVYKFNVCKLWKLELELEMKIRPNVFYSELLHELSKWVTLIFDAIIKLKEKYVISI